MKANLKRCPYCNSHKLTIFRSMDISSVQCLSCGSCGPVAANDSRAVLLFNDGLPETSALVRNHQSNRSDMKEIELE